MKVLVTCANGFVGSHVVNELLDRDYEVIATSAHIKSKNIQPWISDKRVTIKQIDLSDTIVSPYRVFGKPDLLIHTAWNGLPNYKELHHVQRNLSDSIRLITGMVEGGLPALSVIGTCFEYGLQDGCLKTTTPTKPCTPYGFAKDTLRKFVVLLALPDWKWIRLFYLYGPGQNENSLLSLLDQAINRGDKMFPMTGGSQLRDYMHVAMAAE